MISFNNFFEDDIKEIMKALLFVRAKIEDYYEKLGEKVSPEFRKPIRDASTSWPLNKKRTNLHLYLSQSFPVVNNNNKTSF